MRRLILAGLIIGGLTLSALGSQHKETGPSGGNGSGSFVDWVKTVLLGAPPPTYKK